MYVAIYLDTVYGIVFLAPFINGDQMLFLFLEKILNSNNCNSNKNGTLEFCR